MSVDPDFLARKRRYEQQIFNAINDRSYHGGIGPTDAEDWRWWRMKTGGLRAHHPLPHHAASGAELQWHVPVAQWPVEDENHTLVRLTPENQNAYEADPRFQNVDEFGRKYATLGAGPSSLMDLALHKAELASFANQQYDVAPHPQGIPIARPDLSADDYINLLLSLDAAYDDGLPYQLFPVGQRRPARNARDLSAPGPNWNSNSYTSGLITASGVVPPRLPIEAPGYDKPVPPTYFGR